MTANKDERLRFGHAVVDVISKEQVLAWARELLLREDRTQSAVIVTVNAQFVHLAGKQPRFAVYIERADLSVADGMSLVFGSQLLGKRLPERITGVDLTSDLCELLDVQGGSVYLMGGAPGSAAGAAEVLQRRYVDLHIAGVDCPPMGFEKGAATAGAVLAKIEAAHPDLLLVGLGAPKQEYWIEQNLSVLSAKLVVGVGATFDILSNHVRRAPAWMQRCNLEWFFRFCLEPGRLWRRYLVGNSYFIWVVLAQCITQTLRGKRVREAEVAQ